MQCSFCLKSDFEYIANKDSKTKEKLSVGMCCNCGLIQQTLTPSKTELSIYYSHNYRNDYKKTFSPRKKHIFRAAHTAINRIKFLHSMDIRKGKLLDIGAGGGEFVYIANKNGFNAEGIEPNIGYSEFAKNEYGEKITTGEIEEITNQYDIITIFHVMEHLPSPSKAFEKIFSHMSKKGILFVEVPWIEAKDASPHNIFFKAHIYYFSIETLIACASQWFKPIKISTSNNLRILFEPLHEKSEKRLPSKESVRNIRERIRKKGWWEYIFKGKGYIKPFKIFTKILKERNIKKKTAKQIIDDLLIDI